jgi:hypothetical protein
MSAPTGEPSKIGRAQTSAAEELTQAPQPQVLGTIPFSTLTPEFDDRPPWEVDQRFGKHDTDARRFVDVPDEWELRWLNPRLIDQVGTRYWQPVPARDKRVTVKVPMLVTAENYIRRGGPGSDILFFMPKSWVASRERLKAERAAKQTHSAVTRGQETVERINRGEFGDKVGGASASHPTHTIADGRSMRD